MDNPDTYRKDLNDQIKEYRKLQEVANDQAFKTFFDSQIKVVAMKMMHAFTSGKDGDNVKSWEDFVKVRGEIVARLQPIQEVYGAQAMIDYLTQQLDIYYKNNK